MRLFCTLFLILAPFSYAEQKASLRFVTEDLPPYQIVNDGKLVSGTSFELVQQAIKAANLEAEIELFPWARAFQMAKTMPNVVIFSMARTEKRESDFVWLYKLQPLIYRFYSSAQRNYDQQLILDNLQDIVTATVRGSYEEATVKQLGFDHKKNLIITNDYDSMWALLDQGTVDVVYASHIPANVKAMSKHGFIAHKQIINQYDLYVAANKNSDKALIQRFKDALAMAMLQHNKH